MIENLLKPYYIESEHIYLVPKEMWLRTAELLKAAPTNQDPEVATYDDSGEAKFLALVWRGEAVVVDTPELRASREA